MTSQLLTTQSSPGAAPSKDEGIQSPASSGAPSKLLGKRAVAVVFSGYPADPRPRRAAEALVREGMRVEVICLKENEEEPTWELFQGVEITRIPLKRRRAGKLAYLWQYGAFILLAGVLLTSRVLRRKYDLVHVHNMPDVLVFSALVPKLLGARVILDLHDPMPELMMTIFGLSIKSFPVRFLKILECWSLRFADAVLTVNEACRRIFSARSCAARKITVVMNAPDEEIFPYREATRADLVQRRTDQPFVIMYHGSLVERHGLDLAVAALEKIREAVPQAELRIYGRSTPFLERVMGTLEGSPLSKRVHYLGPKALGGIRDAIEECNVGIIPNRRSIFTELNTPTRIFEYLSQGKPVIAPRVPGILDYFNEEELGFFELGDADDLARALTFLFSHPEHTANLVARGQLVYREHIWEQEKNRLLQTVGALLLDNKKRGDGPVARTSAITGKAQ